MVGASSRSSVSCDVPDLVFAGWQGQTRAMDQSKAPVLDALSAYHEDGQTPFTPPGHKQGRGADPRVSAVLGEAVFRSDVLAVSGLDDRTSSHGIEAEAEALMAEAVGADHAFFSTCGSSLSVKSAMLSVAGPHEKLLVGRDAHKSVVSGLILSGIQPGSTRSGMPNVAWRTRHPPTRSRRRSRSTPRPAGLW